MPRYFALVPAAGAGSRMGGETPKQYLELAGQPLIAHTLRALATFGAIERVFVVLAPDDEWWDDLRPDSLSGRITVLRCGGATRAESVMNGLAQMQGVDENDWVMVHDAARPCIDGAMLARLVAEVQDGDVGGLLAIPVADTLKRADATQHVARTEPRDQLWQAQTPQMFRRGPLLEALKRSIGGTPTDEAQAMEAQGHHPRLVAGGLANLKVTYPQDLALASLILAAR
jgi:2-C-methyl-D-erythritol 4-phosphate cytidylyltransferase